ncbi:CPBP family intramembrane metalloprotease [Marivirga atlantica]|jgi:membrane protease YdiL (CAAX protease family)|uniref:CPBP family intramembrane metalloprotease n=1 Tax=Marivirga atlantica TaxID=1548457 RepID=A0A937ADQ3_9BACT|nr:CPBP family intramembrane glutamic endopeptidase [Marivirga atlantica]MBL0763734.1 CPBP family intramembrane metalloprotease [Marivirga atlantica]
MNSFEDNLPLKHNKNPWVSLITFVLLFIAANVLGQLIGVVAAILVAQVPLAEAMTVFEPPYANDTKAVIYTAQGISHLLGFTGFALFFIKVVDDQRLTMYFNRKRFTAKQALVVAALTFCFMIFNSVVIDWNMNIEFPDFMRGFENWARNMEDQLMELTKLLSTYDSFGEMLLALIVIGVLPAVGEELIFRGLLQNKLQVIAKNPHVAIWVTAIIFGAFHMQFYGVVPRILLGALFGYIYYYSGNIWYAVIAHFVNNGLAVIAAYVGPRVSEDWDATEMDTAMPVYVSLVGLVACIYLFRFFYQYMQKQLNG